MMSDISTTVYRDNGWVYIVDLTKVSTTTALEIPATGETGWEGFFSLTKGGAAIAGTTISLTEASGSLGTLIGNLAQSAVFTAMSGLTDVWEVVQKSGGSRSARRCKVETTRIVT